jgi:hypothetical protein
MLLVIIAAMLGAGCMRQYDHVGMAAFEFRDRSELRADAGEAARLARLELRTPARIGVARVQATPYYDEASGRTLDSHDHANFILTPKARAEEGTPMPRFRSLPGVDELVLMHPTKPLEVYSTRDIAEKARGEACDYLLLYSLESRGGWNNWSLLGLGTLGLIDPGVSKGRAVARARLIDLARDQSVVTFDASGETQVLYASGYSLFSSRLRAAAEAERVALQRMLDEVEAWWLGHGGSEQPIGR